MKLQLLSFWAGAAHLAASAPTANNSSVPSVTIKNGTILGTSNGTVESFKGIPYAQPPVGQLRLRPPQTLNGSFGTITSQAYPTACPQFLPNISKNASSAIPPALAKVLGGFLSSSAGTGPSGEDCLTINVQRPANTTKDSKLPVLFWIYGGGFEFGSTQVNDGTGLVAKSVDLNRPMIFVAVNYRLGGFGWLAGKEMQSQGATNLGLRDQRKGMEWVADNIAAFGGDPDKVTIWGESAGAFSVAAHTTVNHGDNKYNGKPLFRGAIMDSGNTLPANDVTSPKSQAVFDRVTTVANCSSSGDKIECLRSLPYKQFLAAANSVPNLLSFRATDLAYLARPDPSSSFFPLSPDDAVRRGDYARVPTIVGDQRDEGTLFSLMQQNITTTEDLISYMASTLTPATRDQVAGLVYTYPSNATAGSPFGTGSQYEIYPQYKRLAAITGDVNFNLQRRIYLETIARTQPSWSYLSNYLYGTPYVGTFHGSDLAVLFTGEGVPADTADHLRTYYIAFVDTLDPNGIPQSPCGHSRHFWPRWTSPNASTLIEFNANSTRTIPDNFRQESAEYLKIFQSKLRFG